MRALLLLAFVALSLAACVTLTEEECRAGDWAGIGVADGAEGRGADFIENHRRACAKAGVVPDTEAWLRGRERGLRLYCTPSKAYDVARGGGVMRPGCTAAEMDRLATAYDWGRNYWRLQLEIDDLESDIREIDREIAALPPDAPGRGGLFASRSMLLSRLHLAELRQRRYATWP